MSKNLHFNDEIAHKRQETTEEAREISFYI